MRGRKQNTKIIVISSKTAFGQGRRLRRGEALEHIDGIARQTTGADEHSSPLHGDWRGKAAAGIGRKRKAMGMGMGMTERGKWMIRTYKSGEVVEKVKFWVPSQTKRRSPKKAASTTRKQEENDRAAIKHLARLINCNFGYGDLWLTLKYTPEGFEHIDGENPDEVLKAAEHDLELFIRRLRRRFQKEGRELLIIAGTSDTDGETGELVRPHHHIIMPREAFEICQQEWKFGSIDYQTLKNQKDYTPLATYICNQCRRKAGECRWKASRNLKKPAVFEEITSRKGELRPAPGAIVKEIGRYDEESGNHYIRYIPKKREKRGGHKEGRSEEGEVSA